MGKISSTCNALIQLFCLSRHGLDVKLHHDCILYQSYSHSCTITLVSWMYFHLLNVNQRLRTDSFSSTKSNITPEKFILYIWIPRSPILSKLYLNISNLNWKTNQRKFKMSLNLSLKQHVNIGKACFANIFEYFLKLYNCISFLLSFCHSFSHSH